MAKEWYIIHARAGQEETVVRLLLKELEKHKADFLKENLDPSQVVGRIIVPSQKVEEERKGTRVTVRRKLYPRYVFVEMDYNDQTRPILSPIIRNLTSVLGLIGGWENPQPLSDEEVADILKMEGIETGTAEVELSPGDTVRILSGPFMDFSGTVEEVTPAKGKAVVRISLFGRETPVEIELDKLRRT
jgi:transcriptional antiterminator NusG